MREIAGDQVVIALGFASDWLTGWSTIAYVRDRPYTPPPPEKSFSLRGEG